MYINRKVLIIWPSRNENKKIDKCLVYSLCYFNKYFQNHNDLAILEDISQVR